MKKIIFAFAALALLASCNKKSTFEKQNDGVIVNLKNPQPNGAKRIALKVVNNKIIHVMATPDDKFSERPNLIAVEPFDNKADWTANETADSVFITTKCLKVAISLTSGEIKYYDEKGKILLGECADGKSFTKAEIDGEQTYSIRDRFNSPADEAFYGLGQHQSDEFNYKNKNEVLFQYNTKVSVPFVISNKNYGILWNNYSLTKFGDTRNFSQLNEMKLYDKNGNEGGLSATYIDKSDASKNVERIEKTIDYENLETIKNYPQNVNFGNCKVVWEGFVEPNENGLFRFILYYAGYTKVYLNNELVVPERWRTAWNPNSYKFTANLESGKKIPLKIEWTPDGGVSYIGLKFLSPVAENEQSKLALWSEVADQIDYYFIAGNSMDDVISGYRNVTGKSPIMPIWAMGFWQSRERYKTQDEIVGALKEFRRRQIPIDNIVMDWFYWREDNWGSHVFDSARFENPEKMISDIHDMHGHMMISVWPKFYITTKNYKELDAIGAMYQQAVKDSVRDWVGRGYIGSFYDAYNPDARKMFWRQMSENLFSKGIDAWWMDASEPDINSNSSIEYRKKLSTPTHLGTSSRYFNTYALMNAMAIYDGQRGEKPNQRVFLLTRSGFAGLQRYSTATWSGDIGTRWEDMKAQISAGMNFALSGIPYWTMDIGGFCVEKRYENAQREFDKTGVENADLKEWRELNARWYQFGTFAPLFRAHGQFPYREVYNIAPEKHKAYQSILYYDKLRYRLMPYIYSLAGMTYFNDYTIMRALVMDFGSDAKVNNISDQYMFGTALMVCPVYTYGATSRSVYFPANSGWYDFYTGKFIEGAQSQTVAAPYERIPLYVREGSIIPIGKEIQYANEKTDGCITVYVYAGKDCEFTLYEDEGVNYNYEKGAFSKIPLSWNEQTKTLTIGARQGKFDGMYESRKFNVIVVNKEKAQPFNADATGTTVDYNGEKVDVKIEK